MDINHSEFYEIINMLTEIPVGKKIASIGETDLSSLNFSRDVHFRQPQPESYNYAMPAIKNLPQGYHQDKTLDLSRPKTVLWMNVFAIPLLFIFAWLFTHLINWIRVDNPYQSNILKWFCMFSVLELLFCILSILLMLSFHELIHGLVFWLHSHEQPRFALKPGYAYAAAPEWFFPKIQYVIVGLSPFVIISSLSIILACFVPSPIIPYLLIIASFNAAGSLGDLIVIGWVLAQPATILVRDEGDVFTTYLPNTV